MKAPISEIFSSIQGEGLYLGKRHIFVRFFGCNMRCAYCDTMPSTYAELSVAEVIEQINLCLNNGAVPQNGQPKPAISLTGGEPLIHAVYLKLLLKELKSLGLKTYLETNGTLPKTLNSVIEIADIIAMDIKLPSSTQDKMFWDEHKEFLNIARRREVFTKVVVTGDTREDEFEKAVNILRDIDSMIPLVIQPVTPCKGVRKASIKMLDRFYSHASSKLKDVRIIPQVHKIMRWR